jgi:tRNA pseudouridine55 synthase
MSRAHTKQINGILLLDKPLGLSSHSALKMAQYHLSAQKAGHTGSLDPLATGMLPLCFGQATKYAGFLLSERKCYQTIMQLGATTTTGDAEGEKLSEQPIPVITAQHLLALQAAFIGDQQQIPPMYSALKHQGKPLYQLARQGICIERPARTVMIDQLSIDNYCPNTQHISLTVVCSTGTYIRTLVEDMGRYLGCGAYVHQLHRLWVCPFQNHPMLGLDALLDSEPASIIDKLLSLDSVLPALLPSISLNSVQSDLLCKGQAQLCTVDTDLGLKAVLNHESSFLGVAELTLGGWLKPKRLMQQKTG